MFNPLQSARDLFNRLQPTLNIAGQNLQAWGQVATNPQLRQQYTQQVIQPQVQQFVQPKVQQAQNFYQQNITPTLKTIAQQPLFSIPGIGFTPRIPSPTLGQIFNTVVTPQSTLGQTVRGKFSQIPSAFSEDVSRANKTMSLKTPEDVNNFILGIAGGGTPGKATSKQIDNAISEFTHNFMGSALWGDIGRKPSTSIIEKAIQDLKNKPISAINDVYTNNAIKLANFIDLQRKGVVSNFPGVGQSIKNLRQKEPQATKGVGAPLVEEARVNLYHATNPKTKQIIEKQGFKATIGSQSKEMGFKTPAVFLTDNPETAKGFDYFSMKRGEGVMPVTGQNLKVATVDSMEEAIKLAKTAKGIDAIKFPEQGGTTYMVLNPQKIKLSSPLKVAEEARGITELMGKKTNALTPVGWRDVTKGNVKLEDLKTLPYGLEEAQKSLQKYGSKIDISKKPIVVGVDINTGEKQLLDGYHRYVTNNGKGETKAWFIPMKNGDIIDFKDIIKPLSSPLEGVATKGVGGWGEVKTREIIPTQAGKVMPQQKNIAGRSISQEQNLGRTTMGNLNERMTQTTGVSVPPSNVGKPSVPPGSSSPIIPQESKYAYNINLNRLNLTPEERQTLKTSIDNIKPLLEKAKGKTLSNKEVLQAAKTSDILTKVTTREETMAAEAAMLKARQRMTSLDKEITQLYKSGKTPILAQRMKELIDSLKVISSTNADTGRKLQALSIEAGDTSIRQQILKDIGKVETDADKILKESLKVDWENANSITSFYRKFIKPSFGEVIDEYRYNNMLSNPRTHLRNFFSNLVQTYATRPATIALQGDIAGATKYYQGALKSFPQAITAFTESLSGKSALAKPDLERISTNKIPGILTIPTKLMEASDKFFQTLIREGELARGVTTKEAEKVAKYSLFRGELYPEGQGTVLNKIDDLTAWLYKAPKPVRWFVPFLRTPMNFAKQWIEYSPAGLSTIPGAMNKKEQLAKVLIGSIVTTLGAKMALEGRTTWAVPTDPKQKDAFYASGRKPFSVNIGGKWVPMMYFGPTALAMALPAAFKYNQDESKTALTDSQIDKAVSMLSQSLNFFSQQTFLQGIGSFVKVASGDADYSIVGNLTSAAQQVIPLEGLLRYVSTIVDPVYRKPKGFIQNLQKGIPGLTQNLPAYTTPGGEPSTRERLNLFTPYDLGTPNQGYEGAYQLRNKVLQLNNLKKQAKSLYESGKQKEAFALVEQNKELFQQKSALESYNKKYNELTGYIDKLETEQRLNEEQKKMWRQKIGQQINQLNSQAYQYFQGGQ